MVAAFGAYCMFVSSCDGKDLKQLTRQPWLDDRGAGLIKVDRILYSRPPRIVNFLRMTGPCFHPSQLCAELPTLRHTLKFPIREKVAIFLQYVGQGISERKLEEDFQQPRSKINTTKA